MKRHAIAGACSLLLVALCGCARLQPATQNGAKSNAQAADSSPEDSEAEMRRKVARFDEQRDRAKYEAAAACWQANDAEGTLSHLGELLARDPNHRQGRLLWIEAKMIAGDAEEAIRSATALVGTYPHDVEILHAASVVFSTLGRRDEALALLEMASSEHGDGDVYLASYHDELLEGENLNGQFAVPAAGSSAAAGNDAADLFQLPSGCDRSLAGVWSEAISALAGGNVEAARDKFSLAIDAAGRDSRVAVRAACLALEFNQPDLAVQLLEPLRTAQGDRRAILRVLAIAQYRRGDFSSAKRTLDEALSLDNADALSYFLMGSARERLGEHDAAAGCYRRAAELDSRYSAAAPVAR